MRRILFFVAAVVLLSTADLRTTRALPKYGIERYYYSNACYMTASCRMSDPGQVGDFLGARVAGCLGTYSNISETDLIGYDNWKDEYVIDCDTGWGTETLYHGGYQSWTEKTPSSGCYCDF